MIDWLQEGKGLRWPCRAGPVLNTEWPRRWAEMRGSYLGRGLAHSPRARGCSGGVKAEASAKGKCAPRLRRAPGRKGRRVRPGGRSIAMAYTPRAPSEVPTYPSIHAPVHPLIQPPSLPSTQPPIHPFIHSPIHHPHTHLSTHTPVHPSIHSPTYQTFLSVHPFILPPSTCPLVYHVSPSPPLHLQGYPSSGIRAVLSVPRDDSRPGRPQRLTASHRRY